MKTTDGYTDAKPAAPLTKEQALQKTRHYCAYQERCHMEVKDKLYAFGLHKKEVELILSQLIEDNYLNEERFAIQFAGGKFRMKQWGRNKIVQALKARQVSDYCIQKALSQIEEDKYQLNLEKAAEAKWQLLKGEKNIYNRLKKTQNFLLQKGFEPGKVNVMLRLLQGKKNG